MLCVLFFSHLLSLSGIDDEKVIYDTDNRKDVYELDPTDPFRILAEKSIVALVSKGSYGTANSYGNYNFLNPGVLSNSRRLGAVRNLCSDQKFIYDPAVAFCSGTLIAPDRVVTAGHCVNSADCSSKSVMFNYYITGHNSDGYPTFPNITAEDIYHCKSVYSVLQGTWDYAVIHLDRTVNLTRHTPVNITTVGASIAVGTSIAMIGCPSGIPFKIDTGGQVTNSRTSALDYFEATTDSFAGNSGSGVFTSDLVQVGILVRGATDYDTSDNCTRVHTILNCVSNCGEDISYAYVTANVTDCKSNTECSGNTTCDRTCSVDATNCTGFCAVPSASPTQSPSQTSSKTASVTKTASRTASPSVTPSITPSTSVSPSITASSSETSSNSPTASPSPSMLFGGCATQGGARMPLEFVPRT